MQNPVCAVTATIEIAVDNAQTACEKVWQIGLPSTSGKRLRALEEYILGLFTAHLNGPELGGSCMLDYEQAAPTTSALTKHHRVLPTGAARRHPC